MTASAAQGQPVAAVRAALGLWIATVLLLAHRSTFEWMWGRFEAPDSYYSHGILIPLVSLFLLWRRRSDWRAQIGSGSWWALALLIPALLLHAAGVGLRIGFASGLSLWLSLVGIVWLLAGGRVLRQSAFPLGFLLFALPVPMFAVAHAAQALKGWVMLASHQLLRLMGTGIEAEGSFLILPEGGQLLVDDECCGLRSLVALVALGTLMAATSRASAGGRALLVALALPIALVANLGRVLLLSFIALGGGPEAASRFHDPSGYAVYVFAIVFYVLADRKLGKPPATTEPAVEATP